MKLITIQVFVFVLTFHSIGFSASNNHDEIHSIQDLISDENAFVEYCQHDSDLAFRKERFQVIQKSADELSALTYRQYRRSWHTNKKKQTCWKQNMKY